MAHHIPSIYVASSPLHGRGIFTSEPIEKGSIIEICPILLLPEKDIDLINQTIIHDYFFEWGEDLKAGALALGYGSIYNHSYKPNAYYMVDMEGETLSIYAFKNIQAGEEITINYNGNPKSKTPVWFDNKTM